ncbi:embryonal Fyn-associated substrate [Aplochiton taeniatus]
MSLSTVLAKALFDNAAESPEELAFRKGDILMVLEQEQSGGPGWWLCSLHGRQGIAPANRLRLLQSALPPGTNPNRAPGEDSVYLSPGPMARSLVGGSADDIDGVYLSPPSQGEALYQSPGVAVAASRPVELRQAEGGRPRSRSSSGTRPRPDWDVSVAGRPRSPSLRGRGSEAGSLYQTPTTPSPLMAQHPRQPGSLRSSELLYLAPSGVPRAAEGPEDATYLVPRETVAATGHPDNRYLVPRGTVQPNEDVYQSPTGGAAAGLGNCSPQAPLNGASMTNGIALTQQSKLAQDSPGLYQTPTPVGAGLHRTARKDQDSVSAYPAVASPLPAHQQAPSPALASSRPLVKGTAATPPATRGKPGPATHRASPMLVRAGQARVPGSPNFTRKPPPPAPPVRGVTRKDLPQQATAPGSPQPAPAPQSTATSLKKETEIDKLTHPPPQGQEERQDNVPVRQEPERDQVYDTPPACRWPRTAPTALCDDESIYNTPRALPPPADPESEVYDVPTIVLNASTSDLQQPNGSVGDEAEEDVYSVPTLPGLPLGSADSNGLCGEEETQRPLVYSALGPGKRTLLGAREAGDSLEADCGIYDMPALTMDTLSHSCSSSSTSTRRLSVSSNGSGDVQWRASLSGLIQSVLSMASASPPVSSRDLATSLAEILSVWKASHSGDPPPPLQQAWSRLMELLPSLSACGPTAPPDALVSLVQRTLEESSILLQAQGRPRLPSQDSLSRRPLPALPVADGMPSGGGMGSRKGSWIQERPLPPTPQPAFPLPPAHPTVVTLTVGPVEGEDDPSNEYAGIGLTPIPTPVPTGDSVGYVKLQGKPEPPSLVPVENGQTHGIHPAEPRLSPSPPLPVSLSLEDSELLSFYSSQSLAHLSCLADSIDLLFSSVQGNQPPRVFVSRGKSLIVTAHKLVFIGDTLSRLLSSPDLRAKVTTSGGRLCQALKTVVVATKGAAQNYPSVTASQEMVDRVAELSQHAAGFSGLLQRLTEIS